MVDERLITKEEALARIEPAHVDQLLRDQFDPAAKADGDAHRQGPQRLARARPSGGPSSTPTTRSSWVERGEKVVLVRVETSPDDFHGMAVAQGILTARGGATSHAAVVARQIGKPCVAGCAELVVDYGTKTARSTRVGARASREGDWISLDGSTGEVFARRAADGLAPASRTSPSSSTILRLGRRGPPAWSVWTNADKPEEAAMARALRRPGHRPLPHRAHVPRGRAAGDRPRRHPRRQRRDAGQGAGWPPARRSTPTSRGRRAASTPRWPSSRSSSRATSRASSRRWTACRSSSASSTRRSTSSCRTSRSSWSRSPRAGDAGDAPRTRELLATIKSHARAEPDARPARLPPRPDDPRLREDPDAGHPQRARSPSSATGGNPHRQDHDPARRPRERADGDAGAPRGRGEGRRGGGRRRGRLQVRHDDRGPARRPDRRRDRRVRRRSSASAPTT